MKMRFECFELFVFRLFLISILKKETLYAIRENAKQIRHVSIERLKIEMDKLFTG